MKNKFKFISLLLSISLATASFASCGSKETSSSPVSSKAVSNAASLTPVSSNDATANNNTDSVDDQIITLPDGTVLSFQNSRFESATGQISSLTPDEVNAILGSIVGYWGYSKMIVKNESASTSYDNDYKPEKLFNVEAKSVTFENFKFNTSPTTDFQAFTYDNNVLGGTLASKIAFPVLGLSKLLSDNKTQLNIVISADGKLYVGINYTYFLMEHASN